MSGIDLIAAERQRQIEAEGWTPEHDDDEHAEGGLARAAFCYLGDLINGPHAEPSSLWPWAAEWWKPTPGDPIRQLVKAGALIAAEIDCLERALLIAPLGPESDGKETH